ncbi:hypothetical protein B5X24_HaOG202748 [Helicoverpa armigera]|uniref:Uncharacterized protein n=1 Tax=Helicoverpa armigera TaxID=29058 RepID=A0A2W1BUB2_HELAM|nr:hypothetical protein B5X24_HaOG202748 [Helicoverpa armigera]
MLVVAYLTAYETLKTVNIAPSNFEIISARSSYHPGITNGVEAQRPVEVAAQDSQGMCEFRIYPNNKVRPQPGLPRVALRITITLRLMRVATDMFSKTRLHNDKLINVFLKTNQYTY